MKQSWIWSALLLYTIVQVIYIVWFPLPLVSDSLTYFNYAQQAIQENTYYPNPSSIYSTWLVAPVYINYLIGILKINNSLAAILISNIVLNNLQLILLFLVVDKIFNRAAAYAAGLIYMLYLNNLGMVLMNLTEFMFGIFILASIYFYISRPILRNYILAGLFLGLAIGVRPTGLALFFSYICIFGFDLLQKKYEFKKLAVVAAGMLVYIFAMGLLSERNIDRFEYTSTTGPANLIMSANPNASGSYSDHFIKTDSIYKTKTTYYDRNEYLMSRSKEYIIDHPITWLSLIPKKIYLMFIFDGWAVSTLIQEQKSDLNSYLKNKNNYRQELNQRSFFAKAGFWIFNSWQYIVFGTILILFAIKTIQIKRWYLNKHELLLFAFIIITMGLTILSSVGHARYKYAPLVIAIALTSSLVVSVVDKVLPKFISNKHKQQN